MQKRKTQNAQNANVKTHSAKEKRNNSLSTVEALNACKMQVLHKKAGKKHGLKSSLYTNRCMFCQRVHVFFRKYANTFLLKKYTSRRSTSACKIGCQSVKMALFNA